MELQSDVNEESSMEPQSDVVREAAPVRRQRHRLLRGLVWGVGALGLIAIGALGATLAPHYLGSIQSILVSTAPTTPPTEPPASEPPATSAPAAAAEVVLSPEAVNRAGITTAPAEAVHPSHATEVEAARQRLLLLGLNRAHVEALTNPSQIVSDVTVPAPITGVITSRTANLGQVVSMGQELFVVTDLAQVWVIGDLYEQDFQTVRVGSEAALTTPAEPGLTLRMRVTYIDPRADSHARTAKVRVEVPNAEGRLRLGMYVTLAFTTSGGERTIVIPRAA